MNVDPRDTLDKPGTNPNRGMKTRPYLVTLLITLLLLLLVALLVVFHQRGAKGPSPAPATPATGRVCGEGPGQAA